MRSLSKDLVQINRSNVIELDITFTKVVSVKLDIKLLKEIDELYKAFGYRTRSELIREALLLHLSLLKKCGRSCIEKMMNGSKHEDLNEDQSS